MRLKNKQRSAKAPAVAFVVGAAAVVAAWWRVRIKDSGSSSSGDGGTSGTTKSAAGTTEAGPREWQCECGQEFHVTGEGRHRVFWLPDAGPDDPVLSDECPQCERKLSLQD